MQQSNNRPPLYPLEHFLGTGSGFADIENLPLTEKNRQFIPKSEDTIAVGYEEHLPHGTLRCSTKEGVIIVALYNQKDNVIGHELRFRPDDVAELKTGTKIPEWKFDLQNLNTFGTDWDFQSTDMFLWTIRGLRKDGQPEHTIHIE